MESARKDKDWERGQATLLAIAAEESRRLDEEDRAAVAQYNAEQEEARRASIQYRNEVERQEAMRLDGLKQQDLAEETRDYQLKHAAWQDVQNYQASLRDERRKSIAMRLVMSRKQKETALMDHKTALDKMHAEFELKRGAWSDVVEYKASEQKKRRDSVAMRLDSWRMDRMQREKEAAKKRVVDEEDANLRAQVAS